jgi:hypothetical protein
MLPAQRSSARLPHRSGNNLFEWFYTADAQATAAGVQLGLFYHKIMMLPAQFYNYISGERERFSPSHGVLPPEPCLPCPPAALCALRWPCPP